MTVFIRKINSYFCILFGFNLTMLAMYSYDSFCRGYLGIIRKHAPDNPARGTQFIVRDITDKLILLRIAVPAAAYGVGIVIRHGFLFQPGVEPENAFESRWSASSPSLMA